MKTRISIKFLVLLHKLAIEILSENVTVTVAEQINRIVGCPHSVPVKRCLKRIDRKVEGLDNLTYADKLWKVSN